MSRASSSATKPVEAERVARQRQPLERAVRRVQDRRRRRLVDLAALDADQAVLDVVDAADAVGAAERRAAARPARPAPAARRRARPGCRPRTRSMTSTGVGRVGRRDRPLVGVGRRRDPRVLEDAGLARAAPQVDVDRVRRGLGDRDLDAALVRRSRSPGRGSGPSRRASARRPRAPDRARGSRHRSGPGRCPCRCSRGRPRRRPRAWRPRRGAARSAAGRAPWPAGRRPGRARWPGGAARRSRSRSARGRRRRTRATRRPTSPAASTPWRSEPPPRSTVSVTTSTSYCSLSQATATDVSSPPE